MLKKIIKSDAFFYQLYFHLIRKNIGIKPPWFERSTQIYFDGYPRTGNTFLSHLLRNVLYNLKSVHHLHCVAAIKIALSKNIPTYILIRNPLDAIASNYLKFFSSKPGGLPENIDLKILKNFTNEYIDYYSFILKNESKINIIDFEKLIKNPREILTNISKDFKIDFDDKDLEYSLIYYYKDEEKLKTIPKEYKIKNKDGGKNTGGAKDILGSSLPNEIKEKRKKELSMYLRKKENYKKAQNIYRSIIKN